MKKKLNLVVFIFFMLNINQLFGQEKRLFVGLDAMKFVSSLSSNLGSGLPSSYRGLEGQLLYHNETKFLGAGLGFINYKQEGVYKTVDYQNKGGFLRLEGGVKFEKFLLGFGYTFSQMNEKGIAKIKGLVYGDYYMPYKGVQKPSHSIYSTFAYPHKIYRGISGNFQTRFGFSLVNRTESKITSGYFVPGSGLVAGHTGVFIAISYYIGFDLISQNKTSQ